MGCCFMHNDFTLFSRKVPSGKTVVYYYAYNDGGERVGPWTTGESNKTAARNYCNGLIKKGILVPGIKGFSTFAEFADGFWDWDKSEYLKDMRKRKELTQGYADKNKKMVEFTFLPYFGKMKLERITGEVIDKWLDYMIGQKVEKTNKNTNEKTTIRKYENSTINKYFDTLHTMMLWAARKKYIMRDPFLDVKGLIENKKDKKIATQDEFDALFNEDWKTVWNNDFLVCTANKLAALTGMRCCEVVGLRGELVFDDHLFKSGQFDKYGYRKTKTKIKHHVPLAAEIVEDLQKLKKVNGDGFLFSMDGGVKPIHAKTVYNGFLKALKNIGITEEERVERGLTIHAWRHFSNTEYLKGGLTIKQVQAITGHKTEGSTDHYTHFDPLEFGEAFKVQAALLKKKPKAQEAAENERPTLAIYRPENDKAANQEKAS